MEMDPLVKAYRKILQEKFATYINLVLASDPAMAAREIEQFNKNLQEYETAFRVGAN